MTTNTSLWHRFMWIWKADLLSGLSQWLAPLADAEAASPDYTALEAHLEQLKAGYLQTSTVGGGHTFRALIPYERNIRPLNMLSTGWTTWKWYLGLQDGAQPIVLNNKLSEHIYHLHGGLTGEV